MGVVKLYKQPTGAIGCNAVLHAIYRSLVNILDDIGKEIVSEMAEFKLALFVLTLIGIPAYIWAWFIDINVEVWKGIILTAIGSFTGLVLALRYLIKFLTELQEYRRKYIRKKK